jgi:hypothetical protein
VLLMFIYYPRSFRGFVFGEVRVAHVYILPQVFWRGSCLEGFVLLMFIYYPRSFRGFVFGEVRVAHVYILPQVFWRVRVWRGSCYSCLYITPGLLIDFVLSLVSFVWIVHSLLPLRFPLC